MIFVKEMKKLKQVGTDRVESAEYALGGSVCFFVFQDHLIFREED